MSLPETSSTSPAWNKKLLENPHAVGDKRKRVQQMFAAIAPSYDLNNRLHSFWRDQAWRRKAVKLAELKPTDVVVDVACGTGDLTLAFAGAKSHTGATIGIDFTFPMLPLAQAKSQIAHLKSPIRYLNGDAQALPLPDACADVVSIAFGIRNVQDIPTALREFRRILRPNGRLIVLEFSQPTNPILRALNNFYCGKIMPITATLISRDKSGAYKYLPKSVESFVTREKMSQLMTDAGFADIEQFPLAFGVCVCYRGRVL